MKARDATEKVTHVQSALTVCQEELKLHIDQLDDTRVTYEGQVIDKSREVNIP